MRWVAHAAVRPHRCAVIPFVGNSNTQEGFIDTGQDLPGWDPHVYISVQAVKEMARMIGWAPADTGQRQRVENLRGQIAEAEAETDRLREQIAAVRVLKNTGFTQANPPGRPPKKVAANAA